MNSIRNEDQGKFLSGSAPTHRMPRQTASSEGDRAARTTRVGTIGSGGRSTDIQGSCTYELTAKISHF